ncbi:type II toxin-antitoxin system VapC family toxin [Pseudomonas sp. NPDC089734]|uniref:type II toxin-antitoxin system VapC family toxin n=1 Tax=Pseudomonas sp. NPDC089734 TaxID=3364469 RepID=UPI0038175AA2
MFLLDTNVVSELRKRHVDANVVAWANTTTPASLFISAVTVMELETGVLRIERRDPLQGAALRTWLEHHVLKAFAGRILAVDSAVARRCAQLHIPDPRSECDALIAATALIHGMKVVTRNTVDFQHSGVSVLNPWVSQLHEEPAVYRTAPR